MWSSLRFLELDQQQQNRKMFLEYYICEASEMKVDICIPWLISTHYGLPLGLLVLMK